MLQPNSMYIELKGDSTRIEIYKNFTSDGEVEIIKDGQNYYMTSPEIRSMSSDVEAYNKGQELLDFLHSVNTITVGAPFDICLGTVNRTPGAQPGTGSFFMPCTFTVVRQSSEESINLAKTLIKAGQSVPVIRECLRYFRLGYPSIFDMYKIYEIIRADIGGERAICEKELIDSATLKNLTQNLNHPGLQGEHARHARMSGREPKSDDYMPVGEMQSIVLSIFQKWVEFKINLPPEEL